MIFQIVAHNASFITREELTLLEWSQKLERFISLTGLIEDEELIKQFVYEYNLNEVQIDQLRANYGNL